MGDGICTPVGASKSRALWPVTALLIAAGCLAGCGDDPPKGPKALGEVCTKNTECNSLICAGLEGEEKLCSVRCEDPLGDECDEGFRCRRPEGLDFLACVCTNPAGCDEPDMPGPDEDCSSWRDCDDGVECTDDSCLSGTCQHTLSPGSCDVGESCRPDDGGCMPGEECSSDFDCEENLDRCTGSFFCDTSIGRCIYTTIDQDFDGRFPTECGGDDCDDFNSSSFGGNFESCDSLDNDCDGAVDETASQDVCGGFGCNFGACECSWPFVDCSMVTGNQFCVDLNNDSNNCGGCGNVCFGTCFNGFCSELNECQQGVSCPANSTCADVFNGALPRTSDRAQLQFSECIDSTMRAQPTLRPARLLQQQRWLLVQLPERLPPGAGHQPLRRHQRVQRGQGLRWRLLRQPPRLVPVQLRARLLVQSDVAHLRGGE